VQLFEFQGLNPIKTRTEPCHV